MALTWFAGVDWGSKTHHVCVLDQDGKVRGQRAFAHSGEGLAAMADWLGQCTGQAPASGIGVAIEVPNGPVVESLIERGFAVHSINPKQLDRFRDRFSVAGAKDDRRDARVLASALRTDPQCLRRRQVSNDATVELREVNRTRNQLIDHRGRLENQLRDLLWRYYPQFADLVKDNVSAAWALDLWRLTPTPDKAQRVREATIAKLLKKHRIRRLTAAQLLDQLRVEPLAVGTGAVRAITDHIRHLRPLLEQANRQIADTERRLKSLLRELEAPVREEGEDTTGQLSDAAILRSLPGIGDIGLATMCSEANEALLRRDYEGLRCLYGVAPVTVKSGKKLIVMRRLAASKRLVDAAYNWGRVAIQHDPVSRDKYDAMRARGHSHGQALRQLVDRLLGVACAMLQNRTLFDPQQHLHTKAA